MTQHHDGLNETSSLLHEHNNGSNAQHLQLSQSFQNESINTPEDDTMSTIASVAGNILECYDFAIYGYLSDIIGQKLFPPTNNDASSIIQSFLVFGGAFFVRPIGGIMMGYIGDTFSRKRALEISIFLMAFPTFAMGCLPTYDQVGWWSVLLLVFVRLLQGLSVGGQLMSSLVFVVEGHPKKYWGFYASFAMTAACLGTLMEQLADGYWRLPFLCGILVSLSGFYIKNHVKDHKQVTTLLRAHGNEIDSVAHRPLTPLEMACSKHLRSLICVVLAVLLWAGGFYIIWVWLVIFMVDIADPPVPHAFTINAWCLFATMVLLFPFAGWLSDLYGRKLVMTSGALGILFFSPFAMKVLSQGSIVSVAMTQLLLGIFLGLYGSPMCSWMAESFSPESRLTSLALGYNVSMAIGAGLSPSVATWLVQEYDPPAAGILLSSFAAVSLIGLHLAPNHD
ncbi:hypothetical protein ACHAXN_009335 [Cyclotella atomus]